jgi:hypothetical protein
VPSKGTTNQRGYDARHKALRKQYLPLVRSGKAKCWRCNQPIEPDAKWDLGHIGVAEGGDKTQYAGPEHIGKECPAGGNRATKGRGKPTPDTPPTTDTSRPW